MTHNRTESTTCYAHASITVKWTLIEYIQLIVTSSNKQENKLITTKLVCHVSVVIVSLVC